MGGNAGYIAQQWMSYASKWSQQLKQQRASGMKVTTPLFTEKSGISVQTKVRDFFRQCPSCSDKSSVFYIDVIAWNAWIGSWSADEVGQAKWIIDQSRQMGTEHGNRKVWLSNFGYLGGRSAQKQIDVIENSGIFDASSGIDSVYYFGAKDFGGGTDSNQLTASAGGVSIGQALVAKCKR